MVDESELNGMFLVEGSDDIFVVVGCKSGCEKLNTKVGIFNFQSHTYNSCI